MISGDTVQYRGDRLPAAPLHLVNLAAAAAARPVPCPTGPTPTSAPQDSPPPDNQPTQRLARVVMGPQAVEASLGELIGYTGENRGHGRECEAYRHNTRALARILRDVLGQHPEAPHGCVPDRCPRPLVTREVARRWRPL